KKQKTYSEETKFTHRYMFVITSLPAEISAEEIPACCSLRWQAELVFKRLKPLLQSGNIPAKTKESGEVWISGKILLSLLTEKYLGDIDFSPAWNIRRKPEYMEGDKTDVIYNFYDDTAQSGGNVR
ncbi:MAG: transposase, partial [Lachnospiraceae bacterium]|nr:transposase [Lachnospiraceae bacterium]